MTRIGQDAINYARSQVGANSMPDSGLCLQFTRQCFEVGSYYYSAIDAWNACVNPHPGDRNPPPAVPVWFLSSSIYDHVAFYVSPSEVITTYNDDVRPYSMGEMESIYGPFLGWGEDVNTVRVWAPPPPPPPDPAEDGTMIAIARLETDPHVWVGDGVTRRYVGSEDDLRDLIYKIQTGQFHAAVADVQVVNSLGWLGTPVGPMP